MGITLNTISGALGGAVIVSTLAAGSGFIFENAELSEVGCVERAGKTGGVIGGIMGGSVGFHYGRKHSNSESK